MAFLKSEKDVYTFQYPIIAYQQHPMRGEVYTFYIENGEYNYFFAALNQMASKRPKSYILVPDANPARFANHMTRGELQLLVEPLKIIFNPTNYRVLLELLGNDTVPLIKRGQEFYS